MTIINSCLTSISCEYCGIRIAWRYGHDDCPDIPLFCDSCAKAIARRLFDESSEFPEKVEAIQQ
jgi:hypothetical protein